MEESGATLPRASSRMLKQSSGMTRCASECCSPPSGPKQRATARSPGRRSWVSYRHCAKSTISLTVLLITCYQAGDCVSRTGTRDVILPQL
eukprot:3723199-Prymnesium_polylepis.1